MIRTRTSLGGGRCTRAAYPQRLHSCLYPTIEILHTDRNSSRDRQRPKVLITRPIQQSVIDQISRHCDVQVHRVDEPMPPELLARIDVALTEAITQSDDDVRGDALIGLVGIRRGLFPDALTHQPEYTDPSTSRTLVA